MYSKTYHYKGYNVSICLDEDRNYVAFILNTSIEVTGISEKDAESKIKVIIDNLKEKVE